MHHGKPKQSITRKSLSLKKTKIKESVKTGSSANISRYFQKTKSPEIEKDKSPVSSVREPGSQPLAKRQRNDLSEQGHEKTSSQSEPSHTHNDFVSNPIKISPVKCVLKIPLGKNGDISTSLLPTRRTDDVTMVNSVDHVLSDTRFSKCEKDVDSPNLSKTLAGDCMDMSDDSIIPPTPSPVENFKNKSRISASRDKDSKTSYSSSMVQRDYKHIKKPSISLSLNVKRSKIKMTQNSKCNESLHISESVQKNLTVNKSGRGGNHECIYNMENDLSVVSCNTIKTNKKGNESGNVDSVRSSAMKLSRKTFKLSKKVKRADGGKSFSSNKKLGPGDVREESDNDMLLGYGVQVNTVDKGFVKNDEVGGENDECKNQEFTMPQVKTRRKLSLDWSKNSHATNKVQATKTEPTDNKLYMSNAQDNILSQENMFDQERSLSEPTREKVEDMSNVSLTSDEMCQLVNDISWSPLEIKSKRQNVLVSPAKQYVRSKSTETNTLAGDVVVQDKASSQNADSSKQGYRRFLVLEVYRREILDNAAARNAGIEKVLRLFDESDNSEKYCQLRGEWERTEVEHGDIVNIIGKQTETGSYILNNVDENYIVVYPDILVTPTSISTSTKCLRRSVLDKYFKTEGPNQVMFLGTLLHRIFEASLTAKDFSEKFVLEQATYLLQQPSNLTELYSLGISEDEVLAKVTEYKQFLGEWGRKYFNAQPHPIHGVIDFKDGGMSKNVADSRVAVSVSKVLDIEECVWSPKFGLKGQVDSSVEVKINRNPNIMKKDSPFNQTCVLPLELKTGKCYTKLGSVEHRAQVILYSLMMMERYDNTLDTGLLLYLKTGHMLGVPAYMHEKRALVMKRNELIRYLSHTGTRLSQNMPGMLQDEFNCKYCPQLNVCTMYHKSVENGDKTSAGIGNLFEKSTSHLSPVHLKYFSHWNELIALESKAMQEAASDCDIWCLSGTEREQLGYCFSKMSLVSCSVSEELGRYLNNFKKHEMKSSTNAADMHLVKGDYVVVSQENGIMALAAGFLRDVSEDFISVLLDKDLTQCYHHTSRSKGQRVLYRIDKAELSTGASIQWSNLAKLFFADSEEHAKLRRLVVDLESPKFSRENEVIPSISSSQVLGAWSSRLSSCSMTSPLKSSQNNNELNEILQDLNSDQRKAIRKVLTAQDYALILGCPGAGKTHTIACLVRALVSLGKSVLLTSYTHSAVDNILLKLMQNKVDFLRLGSMQKVHPDIQPYVACNAAKHIKTVKELKNFYESKLVVATTCLGVNHSIFNQRSFDFCIVDEASQITQPVCIGSLRHSSIFVLVGDHYQLPPLVQSHTAREKGMDVSLFKRLSECHPHAVVHLEYQYRMHKNIMLLSNTLIYENRLKCATQNVSETLLDLPHLDTLWADIGKMKNQQQDQFSWLPQVLDPQFPVLFLNTDLLPASEVRSGRNVCNESEAALVATITHGLVMSGLDCDDVGVISPYRQQLKVIKKQLNVEQVDHRNTRPQLNVEINTVDKYQGRDKLCVIVSLVRSNPGGHVGDLLRDWRRINVAVTRAKRKLILLGSKRTLNHNMLFQELLLLLEKNSWIYTLPNCAWRGLLPW